MAVGIDIVYIPRMKGKEALARRILSDDEYAIYRKRLDKEQFLAGRFAAKEAFIKAKRASIGQVPLHSISITYDNFGAPVLWFEKESFDVSISHDTDYAISIVNIEDKKK